MKVRCYIYTIEGLPESYQFKPWPHTDFIYEEGKWWVICWRKKRTQRMGGALERHYGAKPFTGSIPMITANFLHGITVTRSADGSTTTFTLVAPERQFGYMQNYPPPAPNREVA